MILHRLGRECANIDRNQSMNPIDSETEKLYIENEKNYSAIIRTYTQYMRANVLTNHIFKMVYFIGSCVILFTITCAMKDVIYTTLGRIENINRVFDDSTLLSMAEILFGTLGAFMTSIIVIPLTVVKYLFNKKDTNQFTELLRIIQKHSENMIKIKGKIPPIDTANINMPTENTPNATGS